MKLGFSQSEIITTAKNLGLPTDGFIQRRVARAYDLLETNKVSQIDDGIFRVRSQYEPDKSYIVNLNHGEPSCNCPDGERTIHCKHRIASLLYARRQAIIKTTDGGDGDYWRRCWLIAQGNKRTVVYDERDRRLFCNCGAYYQDCEHKQLVIQAVKTELKKRIVNECGSNEARALQDKLNGQLNSRNGNGNGAENNAPSQQPQLDISDPFQEAESLDIAQIEGRKDGELAWKLSNGEYVISYAGVMKLAEKHGSAGVAVSNFPIEFSVSLHDETNAVIAKASNGNERVSGKTINGSVETAIELAKRNAARQLLPLAEIKAMERKAKLNAEFNWQKAYSKCVELVGEANVSIIIHDLVNWGKLRADNPSHYERAEWRLIYEYCKKDAQVKRSQKCTNNWSRNSAAFIDRCREAIEKVRDTKTVEANEQPLENSNGKRKVQMDKKLRTWLVETDGSKKEISCREICEQFNDGSLVTRLRAGIDSGADISTVEID